MGDAVISAAKSGTALETHVPMRTCLGCRRRDRRSSLLRLVLDRPSPDATASGLVRPDPGAVLPGRGAWVHPTLECLDHAVRRRALGRALRTTVPVDLGQVAAYVAALQAEDAESALPEGAHHDHRRLAGGTEKNRKLV